MCICHRAQAAFLLASQVTPHSQWVTRSSSSADVCLAVSLSIHATPLLPPYCSTYSPVVAGSGRWWLDLLLSLLFAADYVHRTMVRGGEGAGSESEREVQKCAYERAAAVDLHSSWDTPHPWMPFTNANT